MAEKFLIFEFRLDLLYQFFYFLFPLPTSNHASSLRRNFDQKQNFQDYMLSIHLYIFLSPAQHAGDVQLLYQLRHQQDCRLFFADFPVNVYCTLFPNAKKLLQYPQPLFFFSFLIFFNSISLLNELLPGVPPFASKNPMS